MRFIRHLKHLRLVFVLGLAVVAVLWPSTAHAQRHRGRGRAVIIIGARFYDPFLGPYWYPYPYPYAYPPYPYPYQQGPYYGGDPDSSIRVEVRPRDAQVYVDGYYVGVVDDFDGIFQRLHVPAGQHEIVLYLNGFRTVHQRLDLEPDATFKLRYTMERLAPGETTEPVPPPAAEPPQAPATPPGRVPVPRRGAPPFPPREPPQPPQPPRDAPVQAAGFGTLSIRVQPSNADVWIDGEKWSGSDGGEHLLVQVSEGLHRIEVRRDGYKRFSGEVEVRRGDTTPLNVSLSSEGGANR